MPGIYKGQGSLADVKERKNRRRIFFWVISAKEPIRNGEGL
jgi:hypothetical protein